MHTGDLGMIDKEGNIFIKGRSKSMILGPSGKNIYPEEIESVIDNKDYITESLVISEDNKLIGLIFPDYEIIFLKSNFSPFWMEPGKRSMEGFPISWQ